MQTTPRSPSELAPDVPERLGDVTLKAMGKEPELRYASVAELAEDLERALAGEAVSAQPARGWSAMIGEWFEAQRTGAPFEYCSGESIIGPPWIHIVYRVRDPKTDRLKWAKGVIAQGDCALGLIAGGKVAVGLMSIGILSIGGLALGALSVGHHALGAIALGDTVMGFMVAGVRGEGLLEERLMRPEDWNPNFEDAGDPFSMSIVMIFLSITMGYGMWSRRWPDPRRQQLLKWMARFWVPLTYIVAPLVLLRIGLEMVFMQRFLMVMVITAFFELLLRLWLGRPRRSSHF